MDASRTTVPGFGRKEDKEATEVAKTLEIAYNENKQAALALIRSDETPKYLNRGNQLKHIRGEARDLATRSFLYGTLDDAQALVDRYSGTGDPKLDGKGNWTHKEFVVADALIGESVNPQTLVSTPTRRFAIHYGKRGAHVVPMEEKEL